MYLINTSTLHLEEFISDVAPRYAILSHTWEKEEVSFQEFSQQPLSTNTRKKSGCVKINECCRLANSRGIAYAWIDTCCIDKKSSAELSEAINSMYTWYEGSRVCVVYLVDVSRAVLEREGLKHFEASRWFTRGWTLQELLAPVHVDFFD